VKKATIILVALTAAVKLSAQVNAYARVTSISSTTLNVTSVNETYATFTSGMQVIVMQMQDNVIGSNTTDNSSFGDLSTLGSTGMYEVAIISSVTRSAGVATQIIINSPLANTYNTGSNSSVQVISYPTLGTNGFTTTQDVTAVAWNGSVGGVIAFKVNGTLTLNHNIIADFAGFRGGTLNGGDAASCNSTDYRNATSENFGNKGEGIYKATNVNYAAGKGKIINGGGGGNSHNGGGGGGANFTAGGTGGKGWNCTASGGTGGVSLGTYVGANRVFMGGGGGSGEGNNGFDNSGGNGGGIVIITASQIATTGSGTSRRISANGGVGGDVGNDGAGAGGAGGSILLNVNSWNISSQKTLNITANGGDGGSVGDPAAHGGGGGGGQGAVLFASSLPTTNINTATSNGIGGRNYAGGDRAGSGSGSDNAGIMTSSFAILPQRVVTFRAFSVADRIDLAWQVVNESKLDNYEVQRSSDGNIYATIGEVRSSNIGTYRFSDKRPLPGVNIYRLKLEGEQNGYVFSNVASATQYGIAKIDVSLRPNPVRYHATLYIFAAETSIADLRILNMYGTIVRTQQVKINSGENKIILNDLEKFPAGVYQVFVSSGAEIAAARMTICE
jgi:hypothetical protein